MKNKILSKIMAALMVSALLLNSNMVANAKTASTDFGTMTYSLTTAKNSSGKTATAKTSMPANKNNDPDKVYSYVRTKMEVQINSTGAKILQGDVKESYKKDTKITVTAKTKKSYNVSKLAVFSCHEVVGRTSIAKYEKSVL